MCNCKQDLEAKLLERAKEQYPDSTDHSVEIQGYAFAFMGNTLISRQTLPLAIEHTVIVKKTGLTKRKTEKQKMLASYCMFCGEKLVKD